MSRIATVSRAHTVPEKVVMTTKNDGIETGARQNSLEVSDRHLAGDMGAETAREVP